MKLRHPWRTALGVASAALAIALSTLLPATSAQAAPAAGTVIGNQASATYTDGGGTSRTTMSNLVQTTVSQVKSYTLTADGSQMASPGQTVYFPHTITNTGNGTDSYNLNAAVGAPVSGGFTPTGMQYFTDANGDGVPDNATAITVSTPVPAGGQFRFVVAAVVPGGAAIGAIGKVTVNVSDGTTAKSNDDQITVATSAVSVTKSLDITSGDSPRSGLTVTLRYTNSGTLAASNLEITDVLPSGMTYVANQGKWSGVALTDTAGGDPAGIDYSATTVGGVTTVYAKVTTVPPGGSGEVKFQVDIASGLAPTTSSNQAATTNFAKYKTSTQAEANTNNALYTVLQKALVALSASATVPGDTGTVTVAGPAAQGSVVSFPVYAYNTGNGTDTLNISSAGIGGFPAGTTFQIFRGDGTTPLIDTNGDGIVDTGPLAPSATVPMPLIIKATLPASGATPAGPYSTTFTATSVFNSGVSDPVTVSLTEITPSAVDVTIEAAYGAGGALGQGAGTHTAVKTDTVTPLQSASSTWVFRMYVNNRGAAPDTYNLSMQLPVTAPTGWGLAFRASTAGSCSTLGSSITNTGSINGGSSVLVCAVVTVPSIQSTFAAPGARLFELLAKSASAPNESNDYAAVTVDLATVNSVSLSPNGMQQTYAGAPVTYTHSVANLGNTAQTVTFAASFLTDAQVAAGWTSSAYIDDGNGTFEPGTDPLVTTASTIPLTVAASKTIFVRVFAPGSATSASPANVSTLTATYTGGTTSATDTTSITDGLLLLKEQVATSCTVTPSSGYTSNPIAAGTDTQPGKCIGYKITATNTTAQTINAVTVTDNVPANTTLNTGCGAPAGSGPSTVTPGGTATATGQTGSVTFGIASLGANASFTATFCVQINP